MKYFFKLLPSNKVMFVATGILMVFLGSNNILNSIRTEKIIANENKVTVFISEINRSSKISFVYFNFKGEKFYIRMSNKGVDRESIKPGDEMELYHIDEYPQTFIYNTKTKKTTYLISFFLIGCGMIILVKGVMKSNRSLVDY